MIEMHRILKENLPKIAVKVEEANGNIKISNLLNAIESIRKFEQIPSIAESVKKMNSMESITNTTVDTLIISNEAWNEFNGIVTKIQTESNITLKILSSLIETEKENTFNIKLPNITKLKDFENVIINITKTLEKTCGYIHEEIEIDGFDIGSKWIN